MKVWRYAALIGSVSVSGFCADLPAQHTVVTKDTLWDLAGRYYNDSFKWPHIAQANPPPKVHDPHWIYPNQILVIPALEAAPTPAAPSPAPKEEPAAVPSPAPKEESPAVSAPAEVPAAPVASKTEEAPKEESLPLPKEDFPAGNVEEGLSNDFPAGLTSSTPSTERFTVGEDWTSAGTVIGTVLDGERLSSRGDLVHIRLAPGKAASPGARYRVMRRALATDADEDQDSAYFSRIGILEVKRRVSHGVYEAVILRSHDAIQMNDALEEVH